MLKLDPELVRTLVAVQDTKSVAGAARLLHLSQSAISARLRKLEDVTGNAVVQAKGRGISLTPHGCRVASIGADLVEAHDEAVRKLADPGAPTTIRVRTNEQFFATWIVDIVRHMERTHPAVTIEWTIDLAGQAMPRSHDDTDFDVVAHQVLESQVQPDDLVAWTDNLEWIQGEDFHLDPTEAVPLIVFGDQCFYRPLATAALDNAGRDSHVALVCPSFAAVCEATRAGLGVSVVNSRNQVAGTTTWAHATALPPLPHIAQICRTNANPSPAALYLAQLLTEVASTSRQER